MRWLDVDGTWGWATQFQSPYKQHLGHFLASKISGRFHQVARRPLCHYYRPIKYEEQTTHWVRRFHAFLTFSYLPWATIKTSLTVENVQKYFYIIISYYHNCSTSTSTSRPQGLRCPFTFLDTSDAWNSQWRN